MSNNVGYTGTGVSLTTGSTWTSSTISNNTTFVGASSVTYGGLVATEDEIKVPIETSITAAEANELHKFSVGDLVVCKLPDHTYTGKVGKVTSRSLGCKMVRSGKSVFSWEIFGKYYIDFKDSKTNQGSMYGGYYLMSNYIMLLEDDLELVFNA